MAMKIVIRMMVGDKILHLWKVVNRNNLLQRHICRAIIAISQFKQCLTPSLAFFQVIQCMTIIMYPIYFCTEH